MPQLPSLHAAVTVPIVIVAAAILLAAFKIVPVAIAALAGPPLALLMIGTLAYLLMVSYGFFTR